MKARLPPLLLPLFFLLATQTAHAHVGSKDVFEQATAGPYQLYVTIRMPNVIPGQATVEVRSTGAPITGIHLTPVPLTGEASKHPPTSDPMKVSHADPAFYTAEIWIMASGSWQVRFDIDGASGTHTAAVPVPAAPISTLKMDRTLGTVLAVLGLFLVISMAGVVAAAIREARLQPGQQPDDNRRRSALYAGAGSLVFMMLLVYLGAKWWNVEAAAYDENIFQPLPTQAILNGNRLELILKPRGEAETRRFRSNSDFIPDHGHLMHLYAMRQPGMDAVFHLHPTQTAAGDFRLDLPAMPSGQYNLYADVVHVNGFPETLVTSITIPIGMPAAATSDKDDSGAITRTITSAPLGSSFRLPDGYAMIWDAPDSLIASAPYTFRFRLLAPNGSPAPDTQPYMGMAGHAAFVKTDGTVFAHVHPEGSASMAAVMLANPAPKDAMADMPSMMGMSHPPGVSQSANADAVEFPYGFPTPGRYRIFVQMKHNTTVETGVFDANVR